MRESMRLWMCAYRGGDWMRTLVFASLLVASSNASAQSAAVEGFRLWDAENMTVLDANFDSGETIDHRAHGLCTAIEIMPNAYLGMLDSPGSVAYSFDGSAIDCTNPGAGFENHPPFLWGVEMDPENFDCAPSLRVAGAHTLRVYPFDGDDCMGTAGTPVTLSFSVVGIDGGLCAPTVCGDGVIEGAEECDDGNTVGGDGCSVMGEIETGYICSGTPSVCCAQVHEEDDRTFYYCDVDRTYDEAQVACVAAGATMVRVTGPTIQAAFDTSVNFMYIDGTDAVNEGTWLYADGTVATYLDWLPGEPMGSTGENCIHLVADGSFADIRCNLTLPYACEVSATLQHCGDGVIDPGELCDDGNFDNTDRCTTACTLPLCGNAVLDDGEECDDGNASNFDACLASCAFAGCGDGFRGPGEECDDGNLDDNDVCSAACTLNQTVAPPRQSMDSGGGCGVGYAPAGGTGDAVLWVALCAMFARRRRLR